MWKAIKKFFGYMDRSDGEDWTPGDAPSDAWVVLKSSGFVQGQLRLEFDWNDAFIKYLRQGGITGRDEEEMVSVWLKRFSHSMSESHAEKSSKNEFI